MQAKQTSKKPNTRQVLPFNEIRNDTVIMKDGTLRAILMVSSINFDLKSEDEQQAIISAYMQFLNSFTYPIQIVVQSRQMDITPYLEKLRKMEREQTNELLKMQIGDYRKYIGELVELGDIMSKRFYVIVPYDPLSDKQKGFFSRFGELFSPASVVKLNDKKFKSRNKELQQRVEHVITGLEGVGLTSQRLDTQSLIELYYSSYNPDTAATQPIRDMTKVDVTETN